MNLIAFSFSRYFGQGWLSCLDSNDKIMGFRIFCCRISKFIWEMSLADKPIICKKLQFLVTNIIPSIWIQDSRFKAQKKLLQSNLFGFKSQIQGSEKTSAIQPLLIQDPRFKHEGLWIQEFFLGSWILNPTPLDSRRFFLGSWILNPTPLDWRRFFWGSWILNLESYPLGLKKFFGDLESWIFNPTPLGSRSLFGILNLESWIRPLWVQTVFLGSWILNLESDPFGFKKSFWDLESWMLNPTPVDSRSFFGILNLDLESYPLGFKKSFWDVESWILPPWIQEFFLGSWILNPTPLDWRRFFLDLESWILPLWIEEVFFGSWILNLGSDVLKEGWDGSKIVKTMQFLLTWPKF